MAKRAASTPSSPTDLSSLALNEHLSHSAQRQLGALRSALESRLAHLEEVLADPSRGESLAGLILDLSRVATEEAQAAASQACLATKAEAENEIAALRASAKAALDMAQAAQQSVDILDQERAVSKELRRAVEQAQLETQKQSDLLAARAQLEPTLRADRERLDAEVVRQQSIAADLQRALADTQQQLETERQSYADWQTQFEAERAAAAELRRSAESAAARVTSLEREQAEARAVHKAVAADLARERAAAADRERAEAQIQLQLESERAAAAARERTYARLHTQLEAERATVADLRVAAARAEELSATVGRETSKGEEAYKEIASLQHSLADAREALAAAQAELEAERSSAERASMSELRQAVEYADQQLASARSNEAQAVADHQKIVAQLDAMIKEREAIADELTAARKWINDLGEAEAEFALPAAPPHVDTPSPSKAKAKAPAAAPHTKSAKTPPPAAGSPGGAAGEETWEAVRLANRYVFNKELSVQVNGDPARLYDISISGCQLLSPTALKPNQMVKILLPDRPPVTCAGKVVWTRLEPMGMGQPLGYRAGVRFSKADEVAIEAFASRHAPPA